MRWDRVRLRHLLAILIALSLTVAAPGEPPSAAAADNPPGIWAWGCNDAGQLGDGSSTHRLTPVQLSSPSGVTGIAGGYYHTLALKSDGTVWAWGSNGYGQLGDGTTNQRTAPIQVSGLANVTVVSAGYFHSLALRSDGTVWAWGHNINGQLGDGTTTSRYTPVQVAGLADVSAIAAGYFHSLALKEDGSIWAWGRNSGGQLGNGSTGMSSTPVRVKDTAGTGYLSDVRTIAAASEHSLAVRADGTAWGWGRNDLGQLGEGGTTRRLTPVQVSGLQGTVAVGAGAYHSVAVRSDGTVWSWGWNGNGSLGDGSTITSTTPVQVREPADPSGNLTGVAAVAVGWYHTLARKSDGTVWAWGANGYGQVGDGTTNGHSTAVQVAGVSGVTSIAAGPYHSLAIRAPRTTTLVWANPEDIVYGTPLGAGQLNAVAMVGGTPVPGTLVYTPSEGTLLFAGNGQPLSVTFTPGGGTLHPMASKTVQINVIRANLTVRVNGASRVYGDPNPTLSGSIDGLRNGDNITANYSTAATPGSSAGSYAITATISDPSGRLANYNLSVNEGTLTVVPAHLLITADDKSRPFGYDNPPLTGTVTGIKNGDAITAAYSATATATSDPGSYPIMATAVDPMGKLPNYLLSVRNGVLTVEPPTVASTTGLVTRFVTSPGIAAAMAAQLESIQRAAERGNANARAGAISAFAGLVNAQTGKSLTAEQAAILIAAAERM